MKASSVVIKMLPTRLNFVSCCSAYLIRILVAKLFQSFFISFPNCSGEVTSAKYLKEPLRTTNKTTFTRVKKIRVNSSCHNSNLMTIPHRRRQSAASRFKDFAKCLKDRLKKVLHILFRNTAKMERTILFTTVVKKLDANIRAL